MHAACAVLQKCFADVFQRMHAARVQVLSGAVLSLLSCRRLVLMDLARAWPGAQRVRAPLKRLDRLLSNRHLAGERSELYAHMARWLIGDREAVIIVDWSTLKADESWHLLRAALAVGGRTLTLYEEVHPRGKQQSPAVHRAFLRRLKQLLPAQCRPIIVTDAGFRCPWFEQVQRLGWHWIGRVRNRVYVQLSEHGAWQLTASLLSARQRLSVFGAVRLVRDRPFACGLLRYRAPRQGRKHRTCQGSVSRNKHSRAAARTQCEPWLLAYSDSLSELPAMRIVQLYKRRMQIEQSFRDLKCERFGCAFCHSLTRYPHRISTLLLLHALASFLAWAQGCALVARRQTLHCAIRTRTPRPQYSTIRIGWESLRRAHPPAPLSSHAMPAWLCQQLLAQP